MKRITSILLAIIMTMSICTFVSAEENISEEHVTVLTIDNTNRKITEVTAENKASVEEIVIEEGVSSIGEKVFTEFTSLKKITIPNTVKEIGKAAFMNCSKLKTVVFKGTKGEWDDIRVKEHNEELYFATNISYNGEETTKSYSNEVVFEDNADLIIKVNNKTVEFEEGDGSPKLVKIGDGSRTVVPVRKLATLLGYENEKIQFNDDKDGSDNSKVILLGDVHSFALQLNNCIIAHKFAGVSRINKNVFTDTAPVLYPAENRTYLPLRVLAENLGAYVEYVKADKDEEGSKPYVNIVTKYDSIIKEKDKVFWGDYAEGEGFNLAVVKKGDKYGIINSCDEILKLGETKEPTMGNIKTYSDALATAIGLGVAKEEETREAWEKNNNINEIKYEEIKIFTRTSPDGKKILIISAISAAENKDEELKFFSYDGYESKELTAYKSREVYNLNDGETLVASIPAAK